MSYLIAQLLPYLILTFGIGFVVGWASIKK
jgi:hypothetical protein